MSLEGFAEPLTTLKVSDEGLALIEGGSTVKAAISLYNFMMLVPYPAAIAHTPLPKFSK